MSTLPERVYAAVTGIKTTDQEIAEAQKNPTKWKNPEQRLQEARAEAERPLLPGAHARLARAFGLEIDDRSTEHIHRRRRLREALEGRPPRPAPAEFIDRSSPPLRLGVALEHPDSLRTLRTLDEGP